MTLQLIMSASQIGIFAVCASLSLGLSIVLE